MVARRDRPAAMTWFNYTPLAPLIEKYSDDGSRDVFTVEIDQPPHGLFRVSAVGSAQRVELIRVETVGSDGDLTSDQVQTVAHLVDHMITVLRFTTDQHVEKLWWGQDTISIGSHGDANGKPNLGVRISELLNPTKLDPANAGAVFQTTFSERHLFKLLGDALNPSLPLPYKYLCVYRALEVEFRDQNRKWNGLLEALAPYEDEFSHLQTSSRKLGRYMHELRDKCAHIRTGGKNEIGITGLTSKDFDAVAKTLPILKKALFAHLSTRLPTLKFN